MSALSGFNKLPRLIQIILLLIPGVNWITEVIVRVSAALHGKAGKQIYRSYPCNYPRYRCFARLDRLILVLNSKETYFNLIEG